MSRKILIVTGNGDDGYEALDASQRFQETRWEPVLAAPSRRRRYLVFHDVSRIWETYVEQAGPSLELDAVITAAAAREFAALLILGGRAPEYLRNDASLLSLVREFEGPLPFRHRPWNPVADRGGPGARADRDVLSACAHRGGT
jgi:protease I